MVLLYFIIWACCTMKGKFLDFRHLEYSEAALCTYIQTFLSWGTQSVTLRLTIKYRQILKILSSNGAMNLFVLLGRLISRTCSFGHTAVTKGNVEEGYKHNVKWIYFQSDSVKAEVSTLWTCDKWLAGWRYDKSNGSVCSVCKSSPQHKNEQSEEAVIRRKIHPLQVEKRTNQQIK